MATHDLGDLVRLSASFSTVATGAAVDPDVVKLTVKNPDGDITTKTYPVGITKSATGEYYSDVDADVAGTWYFRFWSTGNGQAANEGTFEVEEAQAIES